MVYVVAGLGVLATFVGAITRVSVEQAEEARQQRLAKRRGFRSLPRRAKPARRLGVRPALSDDEGVIEATSNEAAHRVALKRLAP